MLSSRVKFPPTKWWGNFQFTYFSVCCQAAGQICCRANLFYRQLVDSHASEQPAVVDLSEQIGKDKFTLRPAGRPQGQGFVIQLVAGLRPVLARALVADVVARAHGPRRENGEIGSALALNPELRALQTFADLLVADIEHRASRQRLRANGRARSRQSGVCGIVPAARERWCNARDNR